MILFWTILDVFSVLTKFQVEIRRFECVTRSLKIRPKSSVQMYAKPYL